jgi:hypothetical protein
VIYLQGKTRERPLFGRHNSARWGLLRECIFLIFLPLPVPPRLTSTLRTNHRSLSQNPRINISPVKDVGAACQWGVRGITGRSPEHTSTDAIGKWNPSASCPCPRTWAPIMLIKPKVYRGRRFQRPNRILAPCWSSKLTRSRQVNLTPPIQRYNDLRYMNRKQPDRKFRGLSHV